MNGVLGSGTGAHLAMIKSGTGTLTLGGSATNSFDGSITINNGVLRLLNSDLLTNTPGVATLAGAVLDVSSLSGFPLISGQKLEGNGTCLGDVIIDPGATLQPNLNPTPLIFSNRLTLAGTILFQLNRTNCPNAGKMVVAQTLTNGGTLKVINTGPALIAGDTFQLIAAAAKQGSFSQVLLPPVNYGLRWNTNQLAAAGVISVETNTSLVAPFVALNPGVAFQQIHGVGANFCLGPQSIAWNDAQFNLAFSPGELNLTFVRLANSFECWQSEPSIFWSGWDSDNVRFIQKYRAIQTNGLITMSAWSPPAAFKSTGSAMGGTLAKTGTDYRYADYADWWLRSLQYLRDNSTLPAERAIPDFISIQNEPDFTPGGTFYAAWQSGCYLANTESSTKAGYPQALAAVRSAFQSNGFGFVKFIGPDTTTGSPSTISNYLNNLPAGSLSAIGHHPYQGSVNDVGHKTSSLSGLRATYPTSTIYMTEFFGDDSYGPGVPDWMMHALPLHNLFTIEQANTYLMWGLSLSPVSGTFCALGHYSKFINRGDLRASATCGDTNILVSLYRRTNGPAISDRLLLVLINQAGDYRFPVIATSNLWASDPLQRSWKLYVTGDAGSSSYRLSLVETESGPTLAGNRYVVLPPYSIATAVINTGLYTNAAPSFTTPVANLTINPGQTLVVTNTATDLNLPAQTLAYSFESAPTGAVLNATNGILTWRPLVSQAGSSNSFRIIVMDSGTPSLSATQSFGVFVTPVAPPVLNEVGFSNGLFGATVSGDAGPDYILQASTNLASWNVLLFTNPPALPFRWNDPYATNFSRRFYRVLLGSKATLLLSGRFDGWQRAIRKRSGNRIGSVWRIGAALLQLTLVLTISLSSQAATKTWDGAAGTLNWADALNWNPDNTPTSSDSVWLDNSATNPLPQITAQSGANCANLAVDGSVAGTFLNYAGATPLVLNLYGGSVNAANTGPLLSVTTNAPPSISANKINFRLHTSGELHVAPGRTITFNNCFISQNGTRALAKTGAGIVAFGGSGSEVQFTGGLVLFEGTWNAGADTLDLPTSGLITFSNAIGVPALLTSANSHTIAGLAGGNSSSEIYVTGSGGLTITGNAVAAFGGRIRGATRLTYAGTGSLTLNANNSHTGATAIQSGRLALGSGGALSLTPTITVANAAIFDLSALPAGYHLRSGQTLAGAGTVAGKLIVESNAIVSPGSGGAGTLTVTNGFTLAAGAHLDLDLNSAASHDVVVVMGGNVSLAGDLAGTTLGYTPAIGDTFFLLRNTGPGSTTGTLNGAGDGGKLEIGGKWFRVSFTSDFGGAGFQTNGFGNDVALQRIQDPTPSGLDVSSVGATNLQVLQIQVGWLDNANDEAGYRVYRVLVDGSLALLATLPANATNFTDTVMNYTQHRYAVQAFNAAGELGEIAFSSPFQAGTWLPNAGTRCSTGWPRTCLTSANSAAVRIALGASAFGMPAREFFAATRLPESATSP